MLNWLIIYIQDFVRLFLLPQQTVKKLWKLWHNSSKSQNIPSPTFKDKTGQRQDVACAHPTQATTVYSG